MGGIPPFGYKIEERKLLIVDDEAKIVSQFSMRLLKPISGEIDLSKNNVR